MLSREFQEVYNMFKMNFYASLCSTHKELTIQEAFSLDIIYGLGEPTILDYAQYMGISQPNATYKINQLIEKGYLTKTVCSSDKRAYILKVTPKFLECYRDNDKFIETVLGRIEDNFPEKEVDILKRMLREIKDQMM